MSYTFAQEDAVNIRTEQQSNDVNEKVRSLRQKARAFVFQEPTNDVDGGGGNT